MKLQDIKDNLNYLNDIKDDNESAHGFEDSMYVAFVQYIADEYKGELAKMAKELLKSHDIDFARWYS